MQNIWTTAELLKGKTRSELRTAVRSGELFHVARGIYSDTEPSTDLVLKALSKIRGLVYTGWTAVDLYRGREIRWPVQARHDGGSRRTSEATILAGVPGRLRSKKGISLVSPLQAVFDTKGADEELRECLADLYSGLRVGEVIERDFGALVTGKAKARRLLTRAAVGTASTLERKAFAIVREALADLPVTVLANQMVGDYCFDLVIPEAKVAIEIDSYTYHAPGGSGSTKAGFLKDTWKRNDLIMLGWVGQSFTGDCITLEPERVKRRVREVVVPRISRKNVQVPGPLDDAVWLWHALLKRR